MNNGKIGDFIRKQRSELGFTQKELAKKLNCTDKAVSRWETGKGAPDVSLLIPLSKVLNVSVNEILIGEKIEEERKAEKFEETIVNTLKSSKNQISKLHKIIYTLFVAVEAIAIYGFTIGSGPTDTMGLLIGLVAIVTPLISLLFGLTNIEFKYKMIFPWIVFITYFSSNFFYWEDMNDAFECGTMYGVAHLIFSYIFVIIGTGGVNLIHYIIIKSKEKNKNKK